MATDYSGCQNVHKLVNKNFQFGKFIQLIHVLWQICHTYATENENMLNT